MNCDNLSEVREKMSRALFMIKEAVDTTLPHLRGEQRKEVINIWEDFLRELIRYIRTRGRETGCNLFSSLSFHRIWTK